MNDYRDMEWYDGPDADAQEPSEPDVTQPQRRSRGPLVAVGAVAVAAAVGGGVWLSQNNGGGTSPGTSTPQVSAPSSTSAASTSTGPAGDGDTSPSPSSSWPVVTTTRPTTPPAKSAGGASNSPSDAAQKERDESAAKEARAVMELFARPKLDKGKWFAELKPHLDSGMADSMSYTDPSSIAPTKVTGQPVVRPMHATDGRDVAVPTDAGVWTVTMTYDPNAKKWATAAISGPGD